MQNSIKTPTASPKLFIAWIETHEQECRKMAYSVCHRNAAVMRSIVCDPDDVWSEVFLKLQRRNPIVPNIPSLMRLVQTSAQNHLYDKGRKNRTRQSVFAEPLPTHDDKTTFPSPQDRTPSRSLQPDAALDLAESLQLMTDIALSDPGTATVFSAIRDLVLCGSVTTIKNIARQTGQPYSVVRRSRLRLQENIKRGLHREQYASFQIR